MFLKVIDLKICDRGYPTLCKRGVGFVKRSLANNTYLAFLGTCHFQSITHSGDTGTDNEKIVFINHYVLCLAFYDCKNNNNSRKERIISQD